MEKNEQTEEITRAEYLSAFADGDLPSKRQIEALRQAHDIRKFEIELYWKRAAYFWTFIAATFAGYFALQKDTDKHLGSTCLTACLGFLFSVAWYFVNRGSKAWQRNWELHVDLLENEVMGPLYKSLLNRYSQRFWDLTDSYPFSPTKINQVVGLFVILVWLFLMGSTVAVAWGQGRSQFWESVAISAATMGASVVLFFWCRTRESGQALPVHRKNRSYR